MSIKNVGSTPIGIPFKISVIHHSDSSEERKVERKESTSF